MSYYHLYHNITINEKPFNIITDINIKKSIDSPCSTCTLTVPKTLKRRKEDNSLEYIFSDFGVNNNLIRKGNYIKIELGYSKDSAGLSTIKNEYFRGFISNINILENSVQIECEDYYFLFKKVVINQATKTLKLNDIGNLIITECNKYLDELTANSITIGAEKMQLITAFPDLDIVKFESKEGSPIQIIEILKKNYLLESFFVKNTLNIGMNWNPEFYQDVNKDWYTFSLFNRNLLDNTIKEKLHYVLERNNLKYQKVDDSNLQVSTVVINRKTGDKFEKVYGNKNGDKKQLTFYIDTAFSEKEMDNLTRQNYNKLVYNGFTKGSTFTTFGLPFIEILDLVSFNGFGNVGWLDGIHTLIGKSTYLVEGLNITYGNGFRQTISIGKKIDLESDNKEIYLGNLPVVEGVKKTEIK